MQAPAKSSSSATSPIWFRPTRRTAAIIRLRAALEFAVLSLGVKHVVVMGHGRCGGIRAVVQDASPLSNTDFIGSWMRPIKDVARIVPREEGCDDHIHERLHRARLDRALARQSPHLSVDSHEGEQEGLVSAWRLV